MPVATTNQIGATVVPVVRYRNIPAAITWLCHAFGFEEHRIVYNDNGVTSFAQLTFGTAMVMIAPIRGPAFPILFKQPDEIGGAETQVCYFFVPDAHAHSARAKAAGAEFIVDKVDRVKGASGYLCRDPEGHLWSFGTYNPWQPHPGSSGQRSKLRIVWGAAWRPIIALEAKASRQQCST